MNNVKQFRVNNALLDCCDAHANENISSLKTILVDMLTDWAYALNHDTPSTIPGIISEAIQKLDAIQ